MSDRPELDEDLGYSYIAPDLLWQGGRMLVKEHSQAVPVPAVGKLEITHAPIHVHVGKTQTQKRTTTIA